MPKDSSEGAEGEGLGPEAQDDHQGVAENEDSLLVEFEKAGRRISRAQVRMHEAQTKLAQYAERLIDQRFKGEEMKEYLDLPIDQFLKLVNRPEAEEAQ